MDGRFWMQGPTALRKRGTQFVFQMPVEFVEHAPVLKSLAQGFMVNIHSMCVQN